MIRILKLLYVSRFWPTSDTLIDIIVDITIDTHINSLLTTNLYPYQVSKWVNVDVVDVVDVVVKDSEVNQSESMII
jgi:hypothetical protein